MRDIADKVAIRHRDFFELSSIRFSDRNKRQNNLRALILRFNPFIYTAQALVCIMKFDNIKIPFFALGVP